MSKKPQELRKFKTSTKLKSYIKRAFCTEDNQEMLEIYEAEYKKCRMMGLKHLEAFDLLNRRWGNKLAKENITCQNIDDSIREFQRRKRKKAEAEMNEINGEIENLQPSQASNLDKLTLKEEWDWVYNNMVNQDARPNNAPSLGAFGILMGCRSSESMKKQFYSDYAKMAMKPETKKEEELADSDKELMNRLKEAVLDFEVKK